MLPSVLYMAKAVEPEIDVCQDDGWPHVVRCVATLSGTVLSMRVEAKAVRSLLVSSLLLYI